jgi:hypothetical protein
MTRALPETVAALLRGGGMRVGSPAQAFPFLTVDEAGWPHVALLSATELSVGDDGSLLAAMAAPTTRSNLVRTGRASLVAVEGATAHTVKLVVRRTLEAEGLLGAVLDVASHKADSVGVDLSPIAYVPTEELGRLEHWDRSARVLALLRR